MISPEPLYISHSEQVAERLRSRSLRRKSAAIIYLSLTVIYLAWRATIINDHSLFLSWVYYLAECIGLVLGFTVIWTGWDYRDRKPPQPTENLDIDVLIPVYREPLSVIRRTLLAARDIEYPHQTFVLDDGRRQEIRKLAEELGIHYLSRPDNIDAKAGNLNFGLQHSTADFVAVFDADHIAQPNALHAMLGFFSDPHVAMVQSPQDYYNIDAFQYMNPRRRAGIWHDQSWFYNIAQPCRDAVNGASCAGTGVIYRRSALDAISGIPADTVTEDMHTSLRLHKQGYKTIYLNESLAYGIAAADLNEYYKTRLRWAHGNLATLKAEKILTCRGLSLQQRFAYLSLGLIYLEGWQQLMLFLVPVLSLGLGLAPFVITVKNVLIVMLFPILATLLLQEFGGGLSRYWTNEIFAMARWPIHIAASRALFGQKIPWKTSSKNIQGRVNLALMTPQLALVAVNVFALLIGIWRLHGDYTPGPLGRFMQQLLSLNFHFNIQQLQELWAAPMVHGFSIDLVVVAGFWALFNAAKALFFVHKAIANARETHPYYRFALRFPVEFCDYPDEFACTEKISEDFVRLKPGSRDGRLAVHPVLRMRLVLPGARLETRMVVKSCGPDWIEGHFDWDAQSSLDTLAAALYSVAWHREFQARQAYFRAPLDLVSLPVGTRAKEKTPSAADWHPFLLDVGNGEQVYALLATLRAGHDGELISFMPLQPGQTCEGCYFHDAIREKRLCKIVQEAPVSMLPHTGMHGMVVRRYRVVLPDRGA